MKQTDKCECGHKYSKEMNQKHPRRCVICGKKETQPNNILCFRCLEWNKSEEICNLRIKNINDCCEIHNQRLNKSHSQIGLNDRNNVRASGEENCKTRESCDVPSPMPYTPLTKESVDYCLNDYKNKHYWTKVGIERGMIIYQCSQCRKCAFEEIRMIGRLFLIIDEVKEE